MPSDEHNRGCNQDHVISTTESHSMQDQFGQIGQAGCGMGIFIGPIGARSGCQDNSTVARLITLCTR